jgi:hypothetical protein
MMIRSIITVILFVFSTINTINAAGIADSREAEALQLKATMLKKMQEKENIRINDDLYIRKLSPDDAKHFISTYSDLLYINRFGCAVNNAFACVRNKMISDQKMLEWPNYELIMKYEKSTDESEKDSLLSAISKEQIVKDAVSSYLPRLFKKQSEKTEKSDEPWATFVVCDRGKVIGKIDLYPVPLSKEVTREVLGILQSMSVVSLDLLICKEYSRKGYARIVGQWLRENGRSLFGKNGMAFTGHVQDTTIGWLKELIPIAKDVLFLYGSRNVYILKWATN